MSDTQTVREFLRANISAIIAVIDIGELVGEKLAADLPDLVLL